MRYPATLRGSDSDSYPDKRPPRLRLLLALKPFAEEAYVVPAPVLPRDELVKNLDVTVIVFPFMARTGCSFVRMSTCRSFCSRSFFYHEQIALGVRGHAHRVHEYALIGGNGERRQQSSAPSVLVDPPCMRPVHVPLTIHGECPAFLHTVARGEGSDLTLKRQLHQCHVPEPRTASSAASDCHHHRPNSQCRWQSLCQEHDVNHI